MTEAANPRDTGLFIVFNKKVNTQIMTAKFLQITWRHWQAR
jgi:hypothetical protein